eukprot:CAMPEP_0195050994 /NCGR_PEP_ID=MMETSP0448-20130528/530_1 /TAXON_ID=66468 /ORGANISM="Heterocapsa triquestra, Strain CCMP 448" /LENGTH=66 /DNA_ID=CAMNT_0040079943 /DNA_START=60 /DNA_END=256 /DNA_ORIENTATION=-
MSSQSSLLMACVVGRSVIVFALGAGCSDSKAFIVGRSVIVFAILVVLDPEVGCGAIVGRPIVVFAR